VVNYSKEQKQATVDYYLEHKRGLRWTVQALVYPKRESLRKWVNKATPDRRREARTSSRTTADESHLLDKRYDYQLTSQIRGS